MSEEIWKDVPGYEGLYMASSMGRVRSITHGKGMRNRVLIPQGRPYLHVQLFRNKTGKQVRVHRLIASMFCGELRDGLVVNHLDGKKTNNAASNLKICTYGENSEHAYDMGLLPSGSRTTGSKLKEADIPVILGRLARRETLASIAKDYGVCFQLISNIKRGLIWRRVCKKIAA